MRKKISGLIVLLFIVFISFAQVNTLPVKEWNTNLQTPLVLYISGDGGFNNFSTNLCNIINRSGYSITAINAKSYFWEQKTPQQTTKDITAFLVKKFNTRSNQQLIVIGYSFGAEVFPFIINRLSPVFKNKIVSVVLLSPEASTDFEIHWLDMLWGNKKRSMDVVEEINKMTVPKTVTIFGSSETDFPVKKIIQKNYTNIVLPGGHHFDGNTDEVAKTILKHF
jgi:type IV secretory pathway VirJ component